MGFIALKCPSCGADISLDESRDFGFCQYCGTKVMRDIQVIEHRGSVEISHNGEIENLLMRARALSDQGRTREAGVYYEKVLDLDAQNAEAKMGLRLAESIITNPNVTIERLNSFCAKDVGANIVLDGNKIRKIDNGERVKLTLPVGEHTIMFYFTGYGKNNPVKFRIDGFYTNVSITFKTKLMCKVDVSVDVNNT